MGTLVSLVRLGRPLFLGGGVLMYALGAAIAAWRGHAIDARRYLLGQLAVTAFQLMTHYANEYFDYEADRANPTPTRWSGGSRVLANHELPRKAALIAALVMATAGTATTIGLALDAPTWTAPTLFTIAVLAWAYSAPPLRLCARGAGELDTAVVVTGLVPWLGFYLQAPDLAGLGTLVFAAVPLALLQIAMLLAIEFPDAAGDRATGKHTLVVRLGAPRAARVFVGVLSATYVWLPIAVLLGHPVHVAAAAALPAPFAIGWLGGLPDHRDFERVTWFAVGLLVATVIAELTAFLITHGHP